LGHPACEWHLPESIGRQQRTAYKEREAGWPARTISVRHPDFDGNPGFGTMASIVSSAAICQAIAVSRHIV
jgi:hypothetical protein